MRKKNLFTTTFVCILSLTQISADNRIIIQLKHTPEKMLDQILPTLNKKEVIQKILKLENKTPAQINRKLLKRGLRKIFLPDLNGFISLYGGYMDYSDKKGTITFPLRHTEKKLYVAITPRINMARVKDQTISHKEYVLDDKTQIEIYLFEKKEEFLDQKRKATKPATVATATQTVTAGGLPVAPSAIPTKEVEKVFYWKVSKLQTPKEKRINPITVLILSKPKNIYVPTGDFIYLDSYHFVLPEMYVIDNQNKAAILLNTIDTKKYFELITLQEKKASDIVIQEMIRNM